MGIISQLFGTSNDISGVTSTTDVTLSGNSSGTVSSHSINLPPGFRPVAYKPMEPDEQRRLDELEREYVEKRKQARVTAFRGLPTEVRAKIVLDRQVYDAEITVETAAHGITETQEHVELRVRSTYQNNYFQQQFWPNSYQQAGHNHSMFPPNSSGHWQNTTAYPPTPGYPGINTTDKPRDLGLTTQELERAHLDQCAEEMLTK